jgi:subtilisin family serine protease
MARRRPSLIALLATLALLMTTLLTTASANDGIQQLNDPAPEPGTFENEVSGLWFVELSGRPTAAGGNGQQVRAEKQRFRADAAAAGVKFAERMAFDRLFNGLSIEADATAVNRLRDVAGVKAIHPIIRIDLPVTEQPSPDLATAIDMTGARTAQTELGLTGAGIRVAVMDTGIDYHHPDLGGCFGAGCRVAAGWDFVGDDFNADGSSAAYNPTPDPDDDPDDCNGHGTHVAGIVGADGEVVGVAPGVTFGAYRVFGCQGSTTADIMLAAMERSLADGSDILNMSIGSAFQTWPQYPTAVGADLLVANGMIVVASIGNSGANGVYSAGAPGVGNDVIGVASFDNSHVSALTFVTSGGHRVPYLEISETTDAPTSGVSAGVVYIGRGCPQSGPSWTLEEEDPLLDDPTGKVALMDRGICTFDSKYQRAIDAGAVGVVIANNVPGMFAGGGTVDRGFFSIGISLEDGNVLRDEIEAGPLTLTWTDERMNAVNPTGGRASSFTSYGMTAELKLKPDIGAPGGLIRSTYPLEHGGYAIVSGTSMASPHVAGAAALYLEEHPGTTAAQLRTRLQNTADPVPFGATSFTEVVHRQGAGMLDIDDAILSTASVEPSRLSLGEGTGGSATLTITNAGSSSVTYTVSHVGALTTGGSTNAPSLFTPTSSASFSAPSVTVPAGGQASLDVTVSAAQAPVLTRSQYGGYVVLTPDNGEAPLRVPYAGFNGDYQSIQAVTPTANEYPWVAQLTACTRFVSIDCTSGGQYAKADEGASFNLSNEIEETPYFLVHLEHQVRELRIEVYESVDGEIGRNWGRIFTEDYLPRNATASSFFAFGFDGEVRKGRTGPATDVPDGTYAVKLSALKALGDPANPAHWETWTSPSFTIDRP